MNSYQVPPKSYGATILIAFLAPLLLFCPEITQAGEDSKAFQESVLTAASACAIWFAPPDPELKDGVPVYEAKKKEMMELMEKSLAAAKKVPDAFLDRLHPQLKLKYREYLVAGQELALRALREADIEQQIDTTTMQDQAEGCMLRWKNFWKKNENGIVKKLPR